MANGVAVGQIIAANEYAFGGKKKQNGVVKIDVNVSNSTYSLSKEVGRDTNLCHLYITLFVC